jgi:hypothetical protein
MLNGIQNSNVQQNQVSQTTGMDKTGLFAKNNPYDKLDKNFLVDQLDISNDAINLYQKEMDIKKFTQLALSDPEDTSHNKEVASKIQSGIINFSDEEIIDGLFSNKNFFEDLFG